MSGDGPTAISSKLGWLLSGPVEGAETDNHVVSDLIISGELPMRETDEERMKYRNHAMILGDRKHWNRRQTQMPTRLQTRLPIFRHFV